MRYLLRYGCLYVIILNKAFTMIYFLNFSRQFYVERSNSDTSIYIYIYISILIHMPRSVWFDKKLVYLKAGDVRSNKIPTYCKRTVFTGNFMCLVTFIQVCITNSQITLMRTNDIASFFTGSVVRSLDLWRSIERMRRKLRYQLVTSSKLW